MVFHERKAMWYRHIALWKSSGLTRRAYTKREHLSKSSFCDWCKRYQNECGLTSPNKSKFALATLGTIAVVDNAMILEHSSGWKLRLPSSIGAAVIGQLLRELS